MKTPCGYIDGFLLPVPTSKLDEYRQLAERASAIWLEHGALQYTKCAGDDLSADWGRSFTEAAATTADER